MNILNKLTIKHLKMNKRRTIVTIIGIILSTALMVGIGTLFSSFRDHEITNTIERSGSQHVTINGIPAEKIKYVKNNVNIDQNKTVYEQYLGYAKSDSKNEYKPYLYIVGVENNYFNNVTLESGRLPKNENEIVISKHLISNGLSNYKLNEEIELEVGNRTLTEEKLILDQNNPYHENEIFVKKTTKTYKVVGIMQRLKTEEYSSAGYTALTIGKSTDGIYNAFIEYKDVSNVKTKTEEIVASIDDSNISLLYNDVLLAYYGESSYQNVNKFLVQTMAIILGLISIACALVIYNSFAISVSERKKQFGLFSSIGATSKQLRKTVLFEALIVSIIGIPIGILAGIFGIYLTLTIINNLIADIIRHNLQLVVYPLFIIIPVIYMIITIIISVFLPALKTSKISPVEAIRLNEEIKIKKKNLKGNKLIAKLFGIESELAYKNIKRNKSKYRITVISLFTSIVLFIGLSSFVNIVSGTSRDVLKINDYDIQINFDPNLDKNTFANHIKNIENIKVIDKTNPITYLYAGSIVSKDKVLKNLVVPKEELANEEKELVLDNEYIRTSIYALSNEEFSNFSKSVNGKSSKIIFINKIIKTDNDKVTTEIKPLSSLEGINIYYSHYSDAKMNVVNLSNPAYLTDQVPKSITRDILNIRGLVAVTSQDYFDEIESLIKLEVKTTDNIGIRVLNIQAKDYKNAELELKKLFNIEDNTRNDKVSIYNYAADKQNSKNLVLVVSILIYGFITLVTLIGVTSVFNTITTNMTLRRKEFAVLRSIGLAPKQFNKLIIFESVFYGFKALLYGIPAGIGVSILFHLANANVVRGKSFIIPFKEIFISILGIFIIVLLTMRYATNKQKKENILDVIRQENI